MKKIINDHIVYNSETRELSIQEAKVELSVATARLLDLFIVNNRKQLNRDFIIEEVWGKHGLNPSGHSLNKNVSILRKSFSDLGLDNMVETIPRQGFVFQAKIENVNEDMSQSSIAGLSSATTPRLKRYGKTIVCGVAGITLVILGFVFLPKLFRDTYGVVHIQKIGSCEIFTADDNSVDKIFTFLESPRWHRTKSLCKGKNKVIVYYDDNGLSTDNKLKESFFSVCTLDLRGVAHACENYFF
ncbi:winged helix-turn-helix domain-containing protein [Enterobacter mori]|uniref:winged helix-turn-helix domain-containing protein n=1 Tax=Enterobacter mori TaxID=539813 RepID=UPI001EE4885B|nr:winged helix-turn-helix domain-containing protein [Enterobacter mori]MCG5129014.1 winged helix-turn-helix domain-containing protein [Enterobacter mori]